MLLKPHETKYIRKNGQKESEIQRSCLSGEYIPLVSEDSVRIQKTTESAGIPKEFAYDPDISHTIATDESDFQSTTLVWFI
jgi:hypothetical protein